MAGSGIVGDLLVILGADISDYEKKMGKTMAQAEKTLGSLKDFGQKMSIYATAPILAAGTAAVAWAAAEEIADARTSASLRNVGVSYSQVTGQIHEYISGLEKLTGYDDTGIQNSFTELVNITGSARTAMESLSVITDVAAGTGNTLEATTFAVAKALDGQTTALKRMGISLRDNLSPTQALDYLMQKFGGTAAQVAETVQGKWNKIKNSFQNVAETIGHALEPITKSIEDFVLRALEKLQSLADFFAQQPEHIKKFTVGLLGIVAAAGPLIAVLATIGTAVLAVATAVASAGGFAVIGTTLATIAGAASAVLAPLIGIVVAFLAGAAAAIFFKANLDKLKAWIGQAMFYMMTVTADWASSFLNNLASIADSIPGMGKVAAGFSAAADAIKGFAKLSGEATNEFAQDYANAGGWMQNTSAGMTAMWNDLASILGINIDTIKTAVQSIKPQLDGLGAGLDENAKKWKAWSDSLKITTQQLASGIHAAFVQMGQGITDTLASGSGNWKAVFLNFLKASLAATTAWAIAKMTIFETMSQAMAAAISGPWGWVIIPGLIAATIAVGSSSIPALATGGMTSGPTTALIGDNPGGKEVVMPLDSPQTTNALSKAMPDAGAGGAEQTIIFQIDSEEIARAAAKGMPAVLRISGVTYGT